jgi:uncharacterized protein (TIGR03435 family)
MLRDILRACGVLALVCSCCVGQSDVSPHFEVASVKPAASPGIFSGGPGSADPERATYGGTTLEILVRDAYHVGLGQVSGPSWIQSEYYSVNAKLPPGTTMDQYRQMMANLLAERFGLVAHRVSKDFSGYEITVAPGGPKLKPSDPAADARAAFRGTRGDDGVMRYTFTQTSMDVLTNRVTLILRNRALGRPVEYVPVTNKTGLSGKFDFGLEVAASNADDPGDAPYLLSEAFQKQLGLKLNPAKIKLDVIVVDHAERTPTPN